MRDQSGRGLFLLSYATARRVQSRRRMQAAHPNQERPVADRNKAVQILAKSIFRELTSQGYSEKQIVSLATALLNEVTVKISSGEVAIRP